MEIEKIKYLTKNSFYDRESFIASPKSITSIIDDLKSNQYTDWVIGGLKKNSLFKKLVFGSTLVRILEYSNLITVAIPIDKQMLIPEKLFIAVTTKYPLNEIQLSTMLSGLKSSLKEILFFTILEDEEDDIQIKNYFLELQKTYGEYKPSATILKSNNFDYVVAGDTDSIYLNLGPLIKSTMKDLSDKRKVIQYMNKVCEQIIQPVIDKSYQELADYLNAHSQKMIMKREALADRVIWTAKKRYLMNVYDNEGVEYAVPELKIMGLEAIKSSTPMVCRDKIKEAFKIMVDKNETDLIQFIDSFRSEFKSLSPEEIAFPRGVSDVAKYEDQKSIYGKGTPIHVKGSLIYNHTLKELGLEKKYEKITDGDKIKFIYVKEPNPLQCSVISFPQVLPKEFDLHKYLDYNTQFEKTFLEPLKIVIDSIGWSSEKQNTLESLFG
jgi:hypothetical protein